MFKMVRDALLVLQVVVFSCSLALCQDPTGTLEGQVSDPSGALIPHAAVTITNSATGFTASQQSSGSGTFRFSYLPVGSYRLLVSVKGFSSYDATNLYVGVDRVVNLPVKLM